MFWERLVSIRCYDCEIWRHRQQVKGHFLDKNAWFSPLLGEKSTKRERKRQNVLCHIFNVRPKNSFSFQIHKFGEIPNSIPGSLLIPPPRGNRGNEAGEIQEGSQDYGHFWWVKRAQQRRILYFITHLVEHIKGFLINSVRAKLTGWRIVSCLPIYAAEE